MMGGEPSKQMEWNEADLVFRQHILTRREGFFLAELQVDPQSSANYPNRRSRQVRSGHYVLVPPTPLEQPELVLYSASMASELGICKPMAQSEAFARYFSGDVGVVDQVDGWATPYNKSWQGEFIGYRVCPFGNGTGYGDGRAISLAEMTDQQQQLWELQLKGAGTTPWCRGGDGRAVLRSSIREFVASEAMHALGVPTTRVLSLIASAKEKVYRAHPTTRGSQQRERCAITCRSAPSFLRVGSFELYGRRILDASDLFPGAAAQLTQLLRHALKREFGGADVATDDPSCMAQTLVRLVGERIAHTTAQWLRVGFCMGNFQSDNCLVSGRTIDYGPFSWLEAFDPDYCSWDGGDFVFIAQMTSGMHNVLSLFEALSPLIRNVDHDELREEVKQRYKTAADSARNEVFRCKLGLSEWSAEGAQLQKELLSLMHVSNADWTVTFRQLSAVAEASALSAEQQLQQLRLPRLSDSNAQKWRGWIDRWLGLLCSTGCDLVESCVRMRGCNPKYVAREWMLIEAYTAAEHGEYGPVREIHALLQRPYEEQPDLEAKYYISKAVQPMS